MQTVRTAYKHASLIEKLYALVRIAFGLYFAYTYGRGKLLAGPERREGLGSAMAMIGIGFGFVVRGFLATFFEFFGALAISAGLLTRRAAAGLLFTMAIAVTKKLTEAEDPTMAAIMGGFSLLFLLFGSRELSIDKYRHVRKTGGTGYAQHASVHQAQ